MKRWHQDKKIAERNWKTKLWSLKIGRSDLSFAREFAAEHKIGKFRKTDGFDCGIPGCGVCHRSKVYKVKTAKNIKEDISYEEQLRDVG